ncbi:hypothetical protein DAI22_10g141200 [Oryza sativa Japonica Group]|nr:hypothetical protein DAI22_10g141200 [Oryza sativa Japonica Group]
MPNYDQISNKSGNCEKSNDPDCCEDGKAYPQYRCSPPVTAAAGAVLTLNSFEKGKDGGGPSECCRRGGSPAWRGAGTGITASGGSGRSVVAKVVDECDSVHGCDGEHNYEPPCDNNIVDASPAVWDALGLDKSVGMEHITWSDDGDE